MTLKNNITILILFILIVILEGFDSSISRFYGMYMSVQNQSYLSIDTFKGMIGLASMIGALIGGIATDKWNLRLLFIINILVISISSLILHYYSPFFIFITQRIIVGFTLGFLIISIKGVFPDLSLNAHRGKLLFILLNGTLIASILYLLISYLISSKTDSMDLLFQYYHVPFFVLPLLVLFAYRYIPTNLQNKNTVTFSYLFKPAQRGLIYILLLMAILSSFAFPLGYFFISSNILFENPENSFLHLLQHIVSLSAVILGIFLIDKLGRKRLLTFGIISAGVSALIILIISFFIDNSMVILGALYLYDFFSFFIITTSYIIILEYLPSGFRGRGLLVYGILIWIFSRISAAINDVITDSQHNLLIISIVLISVLSITLYFVKNLLLETNGKPIKEVSKDSAPN